MTFTAQNSSGQNTISDQSMLGANTDNTPQTKLELGNKGPVRMYGAEPPKIIRIGIFDSGEGGTRFAMDMFKRIMPFLEKKYQEYPNFAVQFVVLGDAATCPWGGKSESEIVNLTENMITRGKDLGCDTTIIACNTASVAYNKKIDGKPSLKDKYKGDNIIDLIEETTKFFYQRTLRNYYETLCAEKNEESKVRYDSPSAVYLKQILTEFPHVAHNIHYGVLSTQYTFDEETYPKAIKELHQKTLNFVCVQNDINSGDVILHPHSYAPNNWVPMIEGADLKNNQIYYPTKVEENGSKKFNLFDFTTEINNAFGAITNGSRQKLTNILMACTHYGDPVVIRSFENVINLYGHKGTKNYTQGEILVPHVARFIEATLGKDHQAEYKNNLLENEDRFQLIIASTGSKAGTSIFNKPEIIQATHKLDPSVKQTTDENGNIFRLNSDQVMENLFRLSFLKGVISFTELKQTVSKATDYIMEKMNPSKEIVNS